MRVFIIIPAYNEEQKIASVILSLRDANYERIVVIDDGSSDQTARLALEAGATVFSHCVNRGQGASLRSGTEYALSNMAEVIVHFDADGQMRVEDIARLVKILIDERLDVVLGSRFSGIDSNIPRTRRLVLFGARWFNRIFLGIRVMDPSSGFRVLTRNAASRLVIKHDRMAHCSQLLADMFSLKLRVKEMPVEIKYTDYSLKKGQRGFHGFRIIWDLLFRKLWDM